MKRKIVKDYIVDALFELLKKNEINKISITDVINKAGVCRASFYRNFYELEDIIRYFLTQLGEKSSSVVPITTDSTYQHTIESFKNILEEKEKMQLLAKRDLLYLYDDIVYQLCKTQMKKLNIKDDDYSAYAITGASTFLIKAWINNNFKEKPEELIKYFHYFQS